MSGAVHNDGIHATPSPPNSSKYAEGGVANAEQLEDGRKSRAPGSRKSKFWTHFKRFWWLYAIIGILAVVLAVMLTIFIGVKNIAQSKINDAVLDVQGISCTSTETNAFTLGINTTLKSGTTKATVEAFQGVMYLEDEPSHTPFVTIDFPETQNKPFQTVNISQHVDIADIPALTMFNTWLLNNESLRVTVLGYPNVKVPGISKKYGVTFKKTITMPGLNGFDGLNAKNSSINPSNFTDGTNFHTTATIPNKSLVTFEIGNVTFNTYLNGSFVGTSYINDVTLVPGDNVFPFRASIQQGPILTAVTTQPSCKDGIVPMDLSGKTVDNHGQPLAYFANALSTHNTTVPLDLGTPLRALGINPKCPS
ncbi:hypothetical protein SPBR_02927 [Sporothrix brasiliensis 5110]|uniref:Uncharacterized protein n=1 Tax=Sporothrix brasiliensis 5110 TaxID=1398154 RepID=A0A0C2J6V3_9PEZI|nr:uncharacterized protein SPBR_02927 [Sporothrix brasiliensis 5110]KIH92757.1 hypothetical protein SPBR_02927 [Sporothrix brasiliensis 5110]